jgi:CHRD domain
MTRLLCGAAVAAALLISASPSSAQVVTMTANLNGGEETPILNTGAVGTAVVSVDPVNEEISVTLSVFNLPTGTTAGHIHIGPKGIAGPVVINFPIPTGRTGDLPLTFRVGAAAFVARPEIGINTIGDAIQSIVGGNAYVNIHTSQYPAGEIRGQLSVVVRPQ